MKGFISKWEDRCTSGLLSERVHWWADCLSAGFVSQSPRSKPTKDHHCRYKSTATTIAIWIFQFLYHWFQPPVKNLNLPRTIIADIDQAWKPFYVLYSWIHCASAIRDSESRIWVPQKSIISDKQLRRPPWNCFLRHCWLSTPKYTLASACCSYASSLRLTTLTP